MKSIRIYLLCAFTLGGGLVGVRAAEAAIVRFKPTPQVESTIVRLGDIADIIEQDPATRERLLALTIAPAPPQGRQLRLDFSTLRSRLQGQGVDLSRTEFSGSSTVLVTSIAAVAQPDAHSPVEESLRTPLPSERDQKRAEELLEAASLKYLLRNAPELGTPTAEVELRAVDVPLVLNAAVTGYEISGGIAPWDRSQVLTVRLLDENEQLHELQILCRVSHRPFVLAVTHAVPSGHVLRQADLQWKQVDPSIAKASLDRFSAVVGQETKRALAKDQLVKPNDIRRLTLVRSNDIVTVYSRSPGIVVRRQFKSRGEGAMGDSISLVTLDNSRQTILATVTGFHEAEIVAIGSRPSTEVPGNDTRTQSTIPTANGPRGSTLPTPGGPVVRPFRVPTQRGLR